MIDGSTTDRRSTEIEITPEMIEAGIDAIPSLTDNLTLPEELVISVWIAMEHARLNSSGALTL